MSDKRMRLYAITRAEPSQANQKQGQDGPVWQIKASEFGGTYTCVWAPQRSQASRSRRQDQRRYITRLIINRLWQDPTSQTTTLINETLLLEQRMFTYFTSVQSTVSRLLGHYTGRPIQPIHMIGCDCPLFFSTTSNRRKSESGVNFQMEL